MRPSPMQTNLQQGSLAMRQKINSVWNQSRESERLQKLSRHYSISCEEIALMYNPAIHLLSGYCVALPKNARNFGGGSQGCRFFYPPVAPRLRVARFQRKMVSQCQHRKENGRQRQSNHARGARARYSHQATQGDHAAYRILL